MQRLTAFGVIQQTICHNCIKKKYINLKEKFQNRTWWSVVSLWFIWKITIRLLLLHKILINYVIKMRRTAIVIPIRKLTEKMLSKLFYALYVFRRSFASWSRIRCQNLVITSQIAKKMKKKNWSSIAYFSTSVKRSEIVISE